MSKVGAAYLLGSPGDVSEAKNIGVQFRAKVPVDGAAQAKAGPSLRGVKSDLNHMVAFCRQNSISIRGGLCLNRFTKQNALECIKGFFEEDLTSELYVLYYSGHGEEKSGNWVFTDGTVSFNEVYRLWCRSGKAEANELWIISDSCFAGRWIMAAMESQPHSCRRILLICSSTPDHESYDTEGGGDFSVNFVQRSNNGFRTPAMIGSISYENSTRNTWNQDGIRSAKCLELSLLSGKQIY